MSELWRLSATAAVARLKAGEVSPLDLIAAAERRIAEVEPHVNALPTLCFDRARARAKLVRRESLLAGLPVAIKDLTEVAGVRTTHGSPIFANHVSAHSDYLVERLEANGALVIAKSNTPEWGMGANTFNPVFGRTRNPWDTRLSCAGSSGGAAVALATGEAWLAPGSDMGGSLRTPAAFCGIVGLRPSPGRVANGPKAMPFDMLGVQGPMARTVADLALLLDAQAGDDPRDPISLPAPARSFVAATRDPRPPERIGWTADQGFCTVEPEIKAVCAEAVAGFGAFGTVVEESDIDLSEAYEAFQTLRALRFAAAMQPTLEKHRAQLKPDAIWNIEKGLALDAATIGRALRLQAALQQRLAKFFATHDLLACPATQALPYPVEETYVADIAGTKMRTYIDWMSITFAATICACPAISLPCGFSQSGLPIGLQLIAPPRGEDRLLAAAALLEEAMGIAGDIPIDPRRRH